METLPVIHIQIEAIKEKISFAFLAHQKELNEFIQKGLDNYFKNENIQKLIDAEIKKLIEKGVSSISDNYSLRSYVESEICGMIRSKLDDNISPFDRYYRSAYQTKPLAYLYNIAAVELKLDKGELFGILKKSITIEKRLLHRGSRFIFGSNGTKITSSGSYFIGRCLDDNDRSYKVNFEDVYLGVGNDY